MTDDCPDRDADKPGSGKNKHTPSEEQAAENQEEDPPA